MTREEALVQLRLGPGINEDVSEEYNEAVDMAIEVLEQQPNGDCISRQAAINALWKALHEYEDKTENQFLESKELDVADWFQHRIFVQNMSDIDRQTILNLPSVVLQPKEEPQQKTGHWIGHREHCEKLGVIPSGLGVYEWCSNCGHGIDIRDWSRISHSYCPNCGAKMQEVQE